MAILKNVEVFYVKCDPTRPSTKVTPTEPRWEVQIRTQDKTQKKEWEALGIKVKVVDPDDGAIYYKAVLTKKAFKKVKGADGTETLEAAKPVEVVDGNLDKLDSTTIGNGSVANIRIFSSDYSFTDKEGKKMEGTKHTLMGMQLTKHIVYEPKVQESFGKTSTERVEKPEEEDPDNEDEGGFTAAEHASDPSTPKGPVNQKPETAF